LKDTHDFGIQFRKFGGEHDTPRMKDEVAACRKQIEVAAKDFAQAAFDAIALVGLAENLACGNAHAGAGVAVELRSEKPTHRSGLPFAAGCVGSLVIRVPAETRCGQGLAHP
jgi:hypothetical protein